MGFDSLALVVVGSQLLFNLGANWNWNGVRDFVDIVQEFLA